MMLITDPVRPAVPEARLLAVLFGLTEREAELTVLLTSGRSLGDAATQLEIGRETARTHLAHALARTGNARRLDLVRLAPAAVAPAG
jgi:DNA-binding CsgD family transcriptional regulator